MDKTLHTENIKGKEIKFYTQPGVFSRHGLDSGTKLLMENLTVKDYTVIADLGAGSGALGIFLAKLNPSGHVHLLDDHLRSFQLAQENIELNRFKNGECFLSDLFSAVGERTYHQIFSNPPAQLGNEFLEEIVLESFKHLKPQGELWVVVPKNLKPLIVRLFEKIFSNSKMVAQGREHVVIKGQKLEVKSQKYNLKTKSKKSFNTF